MNRSLLIASVCCLGLAACSHKAAINRQDSLTVNDSKINSIIAQMSLDEKVMMLHSKTIMSSEGVPRLGIQDIKYCDGPFGIREEVGDGFRALGWQTDSATYFPTGSALAATWSPELAYEYGKGMGNEARRRGKDIILGPAINIQRLPVGGRSYEYLSEDPILAGALAVAYVKGAQDAGTAACIKHFALNNQETNRGSVNVVVDERTMREIYLKPFEMAVKEGGAMAVMPAYNKVNGTYCSENAHLNNEILRGEWGFKGLTVSDWGGTHSTMGAALGGLDVQMTGDNYLGPALADSVRAGKVPENVVDDKVREILRVRYAIEAIPDDQANKILASQPEEQKIAYEVAKRSVVLLKNEGNALPVKDVKKIAVIGRNAELTTASGGMGAGVKAPYEITPLQGIREIADAEVVYAPAYNSYMGMFAAWLGPKAAEMNAALTIDEAPDKALMDEALKAAEGADVVLFFAGSNKYIETEGSDRQNITLPVQQDEIIKAIAAVNPNIVTVVISGGPCDLRVCDEYSKAVVQGWWNGLEGGHALAEVLFGKISPSGKLPFTYPMKLEDSPAYALGNFPQRAENEEDIFRAQHRQDLGGSGKSRMAPKINAVYSERSLVGYRWFDTKNIAPLYPFGHGLSYSQFAYDAISTSKDSYKSGDVIKLSFNLSNTGDVAADEVAQLYVRRLDSKQEWPEKELKAFKRESLEAGQSAIITLQFPVDELRYWDEGINDWALEPGSIQILVGSSSKDIRLNKTIEIR